MKIGVLGGTFDPPHFGHLALATAARDVLKLDEVIFVPANRNPMKITKASATAKQRLEMVQMLVKNESRFSVSDLEISRKGPSYTVDTINELSIVVPGEYWFILGGDALRTLPEWKQPERLFKLCRIAAATRGRQTLQDHLLRLPQHWHEFIDEIPNFDDARSSSDIREKVALNRSIDLMESPAIVKYIHDQKLYRN